MIQWYEDTRIHKHKATHNNTGIHEYNTRGIDVTITWEYKDTQTQGYTHNNTILQYYENTRIHTYNNTTLREYENTRIQAYRNTILQE